MKARTRVCFSSGRGDVEPKGLLPFGERCREPELNHSTVTDLARLRG
jgi:hypothetical protein